MLRSAERRGNVDRPGAGAPLLAGGRPVRRRLRGGAAPSGRAPRAAAARARGCPDEILLDPWITALSLASWAMLLQGDQDRAVASGREALARRTAGGSALHAGGRAAPSATCWRSWSATADLVEERTAELLALTKEHGFAHWHATATLLHGWSLARQGALDAGLELMRAGFAAKRATGSRLKLSYYQGLMAELLGRAGRGGDALPLLDEAFRQVEATGERWFAAELHRIRGEVLLSVAPSRTAPAADCFRRAIVVARSQHAAWWDAPCRALARRRRAGGLIRRSAGTYSPSRLIRAALPPAAVVLMLTTFSTTSRCRS